MRTLLLLLAGASAAVANVSALARDDDARRPRLLRIESQGLNGALNEWARQTGYEVMCPLREDIVAPAVKGQFSPEEALKQLLRGTPLTYQWVDARQVAVSEASKAAPPAPTARPRKLPAEQRLPPREVAEFEVVTVTGSNIRGANDSASPLTVYESREIDARAHGSIPVSLEQLTQNFGGGASQNTVLSLAGGTSNNQADLIGVNLRGLGNDTTLVLLNGRRLPSGNVSGNVIDISALPLSVLERVEIVPDSASAIYGSDAIAGVVNFILRDDFDGAETRVRHGFVADGDSTETQLAQTVGYRAADGSALASYEYSYRTSLDAADRDYTAQVAQPITLLPQQARSSFFLSVQQQVTEKVRIVADALYLHRASERDLSAACMCAQVRPTHIDTRVGTVGATVDLPVDLRVELTFSDAVSNTRQRTMQDAELVTDNRVSSGIRSVEARLTGSLGSLPGGRIHHAIGAQAREETFAAADVLAGTRFSPSRRLMAAYLELWAPLIGPADAGSTRSRLALSMSGRAERYNDFGTTFNPRVGAVWAPGEALRLRGTYATAFKAPLLNDLNPQPLFPTAVALADPQTGGTTATLFVFGGNPLLEPETATTWTVGFDWEPGNWHISATYYDIAITDRIVDPSSYVNPADALAYENILGPAVVQRAPPDHRVQAIVATPGFRDFSGDLAGIGALVDSRMHNLAAIDTRGWDFSVSYSADLRSIAIRAGIEATHILAFTSHLADAAAKFEQLNTPYNPNDLKARAHFSLTRGGLSFAAYLNHIGSYRDTRSGVATAVSSWTTADVTLGYDRTAGNGLLSDISMTVGIRNVQNKDPPRVLNSGVPLHFDGANANAFGRFFSFQFAKRW
jgi:iron complex outermembrane recepter protein